jgi:hypothetical protein
MPLNLAPTIANSCSILELHERRISGWPKFKNRYALASALIFHANKGDSRSFLRVQALQQSQAYMDRIAASDHLLCRKGHHIG